MQVADVPQQGFAVDGGLNAAGGAVEEADAGLILEPADGLGQRGLGDVEGVGGGAEAAVPGDGEHVVDATNVHWRV